MSSTIDKEAWRDRPTAERQAYISKKLLVVHPDLSVVYRGIIHTQQRCEIEGEGKGVLVLANSGMGKSRLARLFEERSKPDHSGTISRVPVVVFNSPVEPSRKQLGISLLKAMGDPVPKRADADDLLDRAVGLLKKVGTKTIFIDNIHDVPDRRGVQVVKGIGNWIRNLIDSSGCVVVLLGTPAAKEIIRVNSQVLRRVIELPIELFEVETKHGSELFNIFMRKLDEMLPLAELSMLDEPELARRICYACHGILDYIIDLMTEGLLAARARDSERISRSDLANAFEKRWGRHFRKINPFIEGGPSRPLDQPGEPFYCFFDSANPLVFEPTKMKQSK